MGGVDIGGGTEGEWRRCSRRCGKDYYGRGGGDDGGGKMRCKPLVTASRLHRLGHDHVVITILGFTVLASDKEVQQNADRPHIDSGRCILEAVRQAIVDRLPVGGLK